MPRFSVVIPTRNRASILGESVRSVLRQTYRDFELIVVDDGSTDHTGEVLRSLANSQMRSLRQEVCGVACARNAGAQKAEGDFVTFLDDDDAASPRWLENFVSLLRVPGRAIARCAMLRVGPDELIREIVFPGHPGDFEAWVNRFLAGTFAIRRDLLTEVGGYDETLRFGENTELAMRLWKDRLRRGWSVGMSVHTLVRARVTGNHGRYGPGSPQMAEYVLDRHHALLSAHPATRATYLAIVGVHAAKESNLSKARRYLWRSWIAQPWQPKRLARMIVSGVPPVAELVWNGPASNHPEPGRLDDETAGGTEAIGRVERGDHFPLRRSTRERPIRISVVIPTAGDPRTLSKQLEALSRQTYEGDWEVVVSDNGGHSETAGIVTRWAPRFRSLCRVDSSDRMGASHARNVGAREARGDFLAFCDDDDVVTPGWLEELAASASRGDAVGGRLEIQTLNPKEARAARSVATDSLSSTRGTFLPFAPAANCGVWRDVHWWIGGWREGYTGTGEDVDYSWRSQLSLFDLGFAPNAVVHYRLRSEVGPLARQLWSYGLSVPMLFRDYRDAGMRRRSPGLALKQWAWIVVNLPDLLGGAERRRFWLRVATRNAAHLYGSARFRVVYW